MKFEQKSQNNKVHKTNAGDAWRNFLSQWGVPQAILDQAPEDPWIHPPALFDIPVVIESNPSHFRAREVNPNSILDIGCGGGIAAFATDANIVIGVDHQQEMLEMFQKNGELRGRSVLTHLGFWPDISKEVSQADVVVAHHVMYNVQRVEDFLIELNAHALKRVVLELPQMHPQAGATGLWNYFWNIERPTRPRPEDLMDVISELGIQAHLELWEGETRNTVSLEMEAHFARIRLCLPPHREPDVLEFLRNHPAQKLRPLATIWWDIQR